MSDGLNGRRAGSDNGHPLVSELAQYRSLLAATGVIVVPTCGVKYLSTEILHAADPWHFGRIDGPIRHDHEARTQLVPTIGRDFPPPNSSVPFHRKNLGMEQRPAIQNRSRSEENQFELQSIMRT